MAHRQIDPLNPRRLTLAADGESVEFSTVEVGELTSPPPWVRDPDVPTGRMGLHHLESKILAQRRRVWVYTPAGYTRHRGPFSLAILFDGWLYGNALAAPVVLDNLIAQERVPPMVALLVDVGDARQRQRELACDMPFAVHVAYELIPWAEERFHLSRDPRRSAVGGAGLGGLAAAFCAWQWPERLGKVLSQSGAFAWSPEHDAQDQWIARQFQRTQGISLGFHLQVGSLEDAAEGTSTLQANRNLRDALRLKGHEVTNVEHEGGHDPLCWRAGLADGLIALFGGGDA